MAFKGSQKLKPQGRLKPMAFGSDLLENFDSGYRLKKKRTKDNSLYSMYGFVDTNYMPPPTLISLQTQNPSFDAQRKHQMQGQIEDVDLLENPHPFSLNIQRHHNTRETTRVSLHDNHYAESPIPSLFTPCSSPTNFEINGENTEQTSIFNLTSIHHSATAYQSRNIKKREIIPVNYTSSPNSDNKSVHWILSPQKHLNFDKKGELRAQGPFSREFSVHCSPPYKWMKKKAGLIK